MVRQIRANYATMAYDSAGNDFDDFSEVLPGSGQDRCSLIRLPFEMFAMFVHVKGGKLLLFPVELTRNL
jgi:hypothetical protein